ncbi:MAG TPA: hypothetical protein VIH86_15650, partial [Puia sp.]
GFLSEDGSLGKPLWIDKDRIVLGTSHEVEEINEDNVKKLLSGIRLDIFDYDQKYNQRTKTENFLSDKIPILVDQNGGNSDNLKYHSIITNYLNGFPDFGVFIEEADKSGKSARIRATNCSITMLYEIAYGKLKEDSENANYPIGAAPLPVYLMDPKVQNISLFSPDAKKMDSLKFSACYCYELIVPRASPEELLTIMQQDLNRFFPYQAFLEKRKINCFVLVSSDNNQLSTKGEKPLFEKDNFGLTIVNQPVSKLAYALEYYLHNKNIHFVLDETGIKKNIDFTIIADLLHDKGEVREALQQKGADLIEAIREIDVLVIKDKTVRDRAFN